MKTKILFIASIALAFVLLGCKSQQTTAHNSQNSLDWHGLYKATFISADNDCGGVSVLLNIKEDLTYTQQSACVKSLDNITNTAGTFKWNRLGSEITLTDDATKQKTVYQVRENQLQKLSENGKRIVYAATAQNNMIKISTEEITEKYWKLIEINGKAVKMDESLNREPHLILKKDNNRLTGTGGCNFFNGAYELKDMNRISFAKVATTQMACLNMEIESELLKVLSAVDNYTLSPDGNTLSLNKARMAPLARFEVVYLR